MNEKINEELVKMIAWVFFFLGLIFFIVITLAVRYRKRKRENEELKIQFSEQLLKSQLEIQEQTLQHVSREIHDNLGQMASLIKINLNTIQLKDLSAAENKIENTKELVRQLITDLKLLSSSLNSDKISKAGLMRVLESEIGRINKTGVFEGNFSQLHDVPELPPEKGIIIYRMCQEILNNSIKHSEAAHIYINADFDKNVFILKIGDDGVGFDIDSTMNDTDNNGNGLTNLQNRAKVINATVDFKSEKGKGTETTIAMPL